MTFLVGCKITIDTYVEWNSCQPCPKCSVWAPLLPLFSLSYSAGKESKTWATGRLDPDQGCCARVFSCSAINSCAVCQQFFLTKCVRGKRQGCHRHQRCWHFGGCLIIQVPRQRCSSYPQRLMKPFTKLLPISDHHVTNNKGPGF